MLSADFIYKNYILLLVWVIFFSFFLVSGMAKLLSNTNITAPAMWLVKSDSGGRTERRHEGRTILNRIVIVIISFNQTAFFRMINYKSSLWITEIEQSIGVGWCVGLVGGWGSEWYPQWGSSGGAETQSSQFIMCCWCHMEPHDTSTHSHAWLPGLREQK